ncbi:hypothetical protein [Streptomyces sp. bgisy022]
MRHLRYLQPPLAITDPPVGWNYNNLAAAADFSGATVKTEF